MPTQCAKYSGPVVIRATRLDACGRPVYGDCSQVVTDGFTTLTISPEVEEGETTTTNKANGSPCTTRTTPDTLQHYTVEIEFCEVDPDLFAMLNPKNRTLHDYAGNVVGNAGTAGVIPNDLGVALELWISLDQAASDVCAGTAGGGGAWGYMPLFRVVGATPGDMEFGEEGVTFSITGKTRSGVGWRRGPYDVVAQAGGVPGPLLELPQADDHFFRLITTIAPPEPECGCQPVDRPLPDAADLYIQGIPGESPRRTVRLRADNHGFGPVVIDWGDSSDTTEAADGTWVEHTYAADGDYTIEVCDKQTPAVCTSREVKVPVPADEPTITFAKGTNPLDVQATITVPSHASRIVTVQWGDGSEVETLTVNASGTVTRVHTYPVAATYRVIARRGDITTLRTSSAVTVPIP